MVFRAQTYMGKISLCFSPVSYMPGKTELMK